MFFLKYTIYSTLFLLSTYSLSYATNSFTVNISATIMVTTCNIASTEGDNRDINIDFNDIIVSNVNGDNYIKNIPYKVNCSGGANDNPALEISFTGASANFNNRLLKTSEDNLGLQLNVDDKKIGLSDIIKFNYKSPPKLSVMPIIGNASAIKQGGEFTSTVIINLGYQ
ncbi:fimbrial protein [Providencia sp. Me31A]|uniref:hypothetical protein n=1 Tax=Providencia sp. Me31A TaxID=3392637 RepID=UPI003D2D6B03